LVARLIAHDEEDVMTSRDWTRRSVIHGLAAAALVAALPIAPSDASANGPAAQPREPEARRRWALARMDEMAAERLRCHERFRTPKQIRDCQAEFERRYRAYNELYIEATRE
jgi:hypothetical protein